MPPAQLALDMGAESPHAVHPAGGDSSHPRMPDPPACNLALATLPAELATWLATLKGRVTTTLRSAVLRLCAWTPLTVEQLATLLAKDRHYRGQSQFGLGCVTDDPHEYSFTNDKRLLGDGTNLSSVLHRLWGADADAGTEPFATQRAAILAFIQRRPEQDIAGLGFLDGPRGEVMVQVARDLWRHADGLRGPASCGTAAARSGACAKGAGGQVEYRV